MAVVVMVMEMMMAMGVRESVVYGDGDGDGHEDGSNVIFPPDHQLWPSGRMQQQVNLVAGLS